MDYVANIINIIKNANRAGKAQATFPYSCFGMSIAESMVRAGFLAGVGRKGKKNKTIEVTLSYDDSRPKINEVKRISSQAKRVYIGSKNIKPVRNDYGKVFVSTPWGVMTGEEAKKLKAGGEVLFEIW